MTVGVPNLFKGIAVVIDNGIGVKEEAITQILRNIAEKGGHTITMGDVPTAAIDLEHFSNAAFFVMDWNLLNGEDGKPFPQGVQIPAALKADMVKRNIDFLQRLSRNRHAPVFIFTNEDPSEVIGHLEDADFYKGAQQSHIMVKSKADVLDKVYEVLEEWGRTRPSVVTLKTWERSVNKAANELFIDLHDKTPYWPVVFWQTFTADGVPQAAEMSRLLNRLVESRMGVSELDLSAFEEALKEQQAADATSYRKSVFSVLEGERFLRAARLSDDIFAPGDLFAVPNEQTKEISYYLNIRPECDCIRGGDGQELYLLKVRKVEPAVHPQFGQIMEEQHNEAIVHGMVEGQSYSVLFKEMKVKKAKQLLKHRVGRLLPPFVTRVQQRYSTYLQRPGLPRIPASLIEQVATSEAVPA